VAVADLEPVAVAEEDPTVVEAVADLKVEVAAAAVVELAEQAADSAAPAVVSTSRLQALPFPFLAQGPRSPAEALQRRSPARCRLMVISRCWFRIQKKTASATRSGSS
jgi:hypothetical protein